MPRASMTIVKVIAAQVAIALLAAKSRGGGAG
jgi:hypothetical protein